MKDICSRGFIEMIRERKYVPAMAVCESTGNY